MRMQRQHFGQQWRTLCLSILKQFEFHLPLPPKKQGWRQRKQPGRHPGEGKEKAGGGGRWTHQLVHYPLLRPGGTTGNPHGQAPAARSEDVHEGSPMAGLEQSGPWPGSFGPGGSDSPEAFPRFPVGGCMLFKDRQPLRTTHMFSERRFTGTA